LAIKNKYTGLDLDQTITYLKDISAKDESWDFNKSANDVISSYYYQSGHLKYAERTHTCAERLGITIKTNSEQEYISRLRSVYLCHVRLCPVCQVCRTRVQRKRLIEGLDKIEQNKIKVKWLFLTLTVKNCNIKHLRSTLLEMSKGYKKFIKRKDISEYLLGYFRATEVTKSDTYEAHPHFHVLLGMHPEYFKKGYLQQTDFTQFFKESMQLDYVPIVDIRAVKEVKTKKKPVTTNQSIALEVAKYMVKPMCMIGNGTKKDKDFFIELSNQISGIKASNMGGIVRKYCKQEEPTPDEILKASQQDKIDYPIDDIHLNFTWIKTQKRYGIKNN